MKTFILDIIPKIQRFSQKLDNITTLTNKHWVIIDDNIEKKVVYIFREKENQLLISENGSIEKGNWEYLGNNSLLIDKKEGSYLFKHGFIDDYILALKLDGKEEYALLVNEQKFDATLNSLDSIITFLTNTYSTQRINVSIPKQNQSTESRIIQVLSEPTDNFDISFYPQIAKDVDEINSSTKQLEYLKADIIIGFCKDHSIPAEFHRENKNLVELVTHKKIPIQNIEALFDKSRNKLNFREEFEQYLREKL